jgi:hypothetical protein
VQFPKDFPAPVTQASVWSVRRLAACHYVVTFCCRQRSRGRFEVLVAPWLWQDFGLPELNEDDLALCAAGVVLDSFFPADIAIPPVLDLDTLAHVDPHFIPALRQRLAGSVRRRSARLT